MHCLGVHSSEKEHIIQESDIEGTPRADRECEEKFVCLFIYIVLYIHAF